MDEASKKVNELRQQSNYPEVFRRLLEEALEGVSGEIVARVNPEDVTLAKKLLAELQVAGEVKPVPEITGGVIVEEAKGNVTIINTFQSRLRKAAQVYKTEVARIIFPES